MTCWDLCPQTFLLLELVLEFPHSNPTITIRARFCVFRRFGLESYHLYRSTSKVFVGTKLPWFFFQQPKLGRRSRSCKQEICLFFNKKKKKKRSASSSLLCVASGFARNHNFSPFNRPKGRLFFSGARVATVKKRPFCFVFSKST